MDELMASSTASAREGQDVNVRVVLVDDDALVRAGLKLLIGGDPALQVVGEACDGQDAEEVIASSDPDVVLMDIRMPRCDGLQATERELARQPDLAILMLTTFDADELILDTLRLGARGFLLKDTPPRELLAAIHAVAAGRTTLSPSVLDRVVAAAAHPPGPSGPRPHESNDLSLRSDQVRSRTLMGRLTAREAEVVAAMARGASNADIAAALFISLATVKTHVGHIYDKLQVTNRVQVALVAHAAAPRSSAAARAYSEPPSTPTHPTSPLSCEG